MKVCEKVNRRDELIAQSVIAGPKRQRRNTKQELRI